MKNMIKRFVDNTTLHGLRHVVLSPTRLRQVVWLHLLLGATVMYLFLVQQSVTKYYSNPFSIENTEVIPEDGALRFPAVTICNLNHFVKSKINLQESNESFYKLGLNMSVCKTLSDVKTGLTCGQALLCAFELFGPAIVENCSETTKQQLISVLNKTEQAVFNPEEFLATYGHEISAMFLYYCRFAVKENCVAEDFLPTLTEHGLCYTFNSGRFDSRIRSTRLTGSEGGLSVILDVEAHENTISEFSRGFRVILHEQGAFINFDEGFNLYPGSHALVGVTAIQHHRLPAPYSSACVQFSLPGIANYTKDGCLKQCQTNSTITLCGCRKRGIPVLSDVPVCTFQHDYCYKESLSKFNSRGCSCSVACRVTHYMPQISYSSFPDLALSKILHYKFSYKRTLEYQRTNLVFLQIGFKHVAYQYYLETPSYGVDSLLGDIGGNMGLFLGCSLLTVLEFMDLAWSLLMNIVKGKKVSPVEDEEMEGTV